MSTTTALRVPAHTPARFGPTSRWAGRIDYKRTLRRLCDMEVVNRRAHPQHLSHHGNHCACTTCAATIARGGVPACNCSPCMQRRKLDALTRGHVTIEAVAA